MATLTTSDIKTIDELPEISGDSLTGQDCFLAFDKNTNSHKKIQATAFKAWVTSSAGEAAASARAAAASAANAAASEQAASGSATSAGASATAADGSATLSQSWAVGGTGTRTGEDTNNSRYYAQQSAASATSAAGSSADAADSLAEVRSALATGGIVEGHRTVVVTADMSSLADVDTTFRIRGNATLTVRDSTVFSTRITIINETNSPQVVSLSLSGGSGTRVIAAGQSWKYVWTGYWNDGVGIAPAVTANDPRPVASGAVQSAMLSSMSRGIVPAGVSIDDMVGPEWVGTWLLDEVAYHNLGHRPYIGGSIFGERASLVITCASHPNSEASETVQTLIPWTNMWTARRIYINGWLNHSDTMIVGAFYGGWHASYECKIRVSETTPLGWNGVQTYLEIRPGTNVLLHFIGNTREWFASVRFPITNRSAIRDMLWRSSLPLNLEYSFWRQHFLQSTYACVTLPMDESDPNYSPDTFCILAWGQNGTVIAPTNALNIVVAPNGPD